MIWMLKNIGVHLWLATLFSIPVVFLVLPVLKPIFPGLDPSVTAMVVFVCFFAGIGSLMDMAARRAVTHLIREGQTWERTGLVQKSKKAYLRAIRIYDTFLFWPFFSRRAAGMICGAIAKFNVNEHKKNSNFDLASAIYLKRHPKEEDVALAWLKQLGRKTFVSSLEQEVLTLVVQHHYRHPSFTKMAADLFLALERKDFTARKLYDYLISSIEFKDRYEKKIQVLVGEPLTGKSLISESYLGEPEKFLEDKKIGIEKPFIPPRKVAQKKINLSGFFKKNINYLICFFKKVMVWMGSAISFIVLSSGKSYTWIKENPNMRKYLKIVFLSVVFLWLAFFMTNTLFHIFKSKTIEKTNEKQIKIQEQKPFTIQVAAYLKQTHADRYVDSLKTKGIAASVKKMDGGGKTWFLVRVSAFTDKESAAEYGNKLKKQKLIDDFFVNNK